jgi:hypothetical protein
VIPAHWPPYYVCPWSPSKGARPKVEYGWNSHWRAQQLWIYYVGRRGQWTRGSPPILGLSRCYQRLVSDVNMTRNITQDLRFGRISSNEMCHDQNWVLSTGEKGWGWSGKVPCSGMWRRVGWKDPAVSTFRLDKWRWRSGSLETSVPWRWKN